jgi:sugar phosphate isomerase/epimerase
VRYLMFSKHLQSLSVHEMGRVVRELGFGGVELTVRPGGHVQPGRVEQDLPQAVAGLRELGLEVPAIVVEIHTCRDEHAEVVCRAAGRVGATVLRTSSRRYTRFGAIRDQIATARSEARELEALGREYGVRLCIHCHSGDWLSAQGGILATILEQTEPRHVGVSLDVGHLTVEGGGSGWRQGIDLLQERIGIVAAKSFGWFPAPDPETNGTRWTARVMPLAEGNVRWREAFRLLRQLGWDADGRALVSLHSEYQDVNSWRDLTIPELLDQTGRDLAWLQQQAALALADCPTPPTEGG